MTLQKVKSFFSRINKPKQLEEQSTLSKKKTNPCKICFENIEEDSLHSILFKNACICHKCFLKFKPKLNHFKIGKIDGYYIYNYDEEIQKNLYQFKGCFDIELAHIFLDYFWLFLFIKYFGYVLVPAPSSVEADNERGFNHVVEMFKPLHLKMIRCIHKTKNIKQSDLSSQERHNVSKHLIIDDIDLSNKKVLIVDDVYTTGSTVRAMIDLLKRKNLKKIKVLVMSKTKDLIERV